MIRWGELPVPYVAAWSSESDIYIAIDSLINKYALFRRGARGDGKPLFGKMDESRVRAVIRGRKCQVCAGPLGREGYVLDAACGTFRHTAPILNEPLACLACFRISLALCPGIARLRTRPRGFAARVRSYECIASTVQPYYGDEGDSVLNHVLEEWAGEGGPPPVGYLRYALTDYDILETAVLQELSAQAGAA